MTRADCWRLLTKPSTSRGPLSQRRSAGPPIGGLVMAGNAPAVSPARSADGRPESPLAYGQKEPGAPHRTRLVTACPGRLAVRAGGLFTPARRSTTPRRPQMQPSYVQEEERRCHWPTPSCRSSHRAIPALVAGESDSAVLRSRLHTPVIYQLTPACSSKPEGPAAEIAYVGTRGSICFVSGNQPGAPCHTAGPITTKSPER
jgi:hypothetical protein